MKQKQTGNVSYTSDNGRIPLFILFSFIFLSSMLSTGLSVPLWSRHLQARFAAIGGVASTKPQTKKVKNGFVIVRGNVGI